MLTLSAAELGRRIAMGRIDPVELTEAFLDASVRHPHGERIYARLTPERARREAREAAIRAKTGYRRSLIDGVPLSWKDLFDTAGTATEAGSPLLRGRVPEADAAVLSNAAAAGTICLGKTRMTELAWSGLGPNPAEPMPPNAIDPGWLPGGSSSGAAASVAFGLVPAATGSDTGGSIRIPAAWNDLVGLKASHGRLPMAGVVPLSEDFDTAGPLTRTVEDAALVFSAMEGRPAVAPSGAGLSGLNLMVLETVAIDECRDTPLAAFERGVGLIADAGARIARRRIPEIAEAADLSGLIVTAEAWSIWRDDIRAAPGRLDPALELDLSAGEMIGAADYVRNWRILRRCRAGWNRAVADFHAVLMPTSSTLPPDAARALEDEAYRRAESRASSRTCRIANQMGACALTLPTLTPGCGLMIVAPPMAEDRLLWIGAAVEKALARARG